MRDTYLKFAIKTRRQNFGRCLGCVRKRNSGFTLTEVGIVLGVMGFLLSGIWTAYDTVLRELRVARMARDISYIVSALQNIGSLSPGSLNVAKDAGVHIIMSSCTGTAQSGSLGTGCSAGQTSGSYVSNYFPVWTGDGLTPTAISTGVIPNNLVGTGKMISPWGDGYITNVTTGTNDLTKPANMAAYAAAAAGASSSSAGADIAVPPVITGTVYSGGQFFITFINVPSEDCTSLVQGQLGNFITQGLTRIGTAIPPAYPPGEYNFPYGVTGFTTMPSLDTIASWCSAYGTANDVSLGLFFVNSH